MRKSYHVREKERALRLGGVARALAILFGARMVAWGNSDGVLSRMAMKRETEFQERTRGKAGLAGNWELAKSVDDGFGRGRFLS